MKTTKVAFLLNEFPSLTETFILNQIVFLIDKGVDIHIFSLYPGDFTRLHIQYQGYGLEKRVTYVATLPQSPISRIFEAFRFFHQQGFRIAFWAAVKCINPFKLGISGLKITHFLHCIRIWQIHRFDLVHAHFGVMGVFFTNFVSQGLFKNIPFLVSFHGYDLVPNQAMENRIKYRNLFSFGKIFTANSHYTKGLMLKLDQKLDPRIRLLPMGIDTNLFDVETLKKSEKHSDTYKLVYVGRLVEWKGADQAIKILEKVIREFGINNIELSIIGKGPMHDVLEDMIIEKGLKENVRMLGGQDQSVVRSILAKADLFLYTGKEDIKSGRAENQGLVLMEAQAMGVPVVAFAVGGISEGINNQETGILIPAGDLEGFAESVVGLLLDKNKRRAMGISAREFVKEKFDTQVLGNRLIEIYQEVLS
ncbi:glycosyltransferase family 4 protein [Aquiflexum gelatinilyticum]|uniref:glycosyltransferase family 4 protein n=1 Tax=Aquiflexum gelatinilyticum TaxID=2961943 RepID=UPI0021689449|nr:glycosyltransferase family 4 protein [Aquiflexum gelatinilyticum]MCS4434557.1 glycosyltransferase family 4 protein [Aquiflexum gelatinilyticum]